MLFPLLLAAVAAPAGARTNPAIEDASRLFASAEGSWSCVGAFANGKPLAANLKFKRSPDGQSIHYSHVDRAPNTYRQEANWGVDKDSGHMISLAFTAFGDQRSPSAAMYVAEKWSADSVTLVHKKLLADPFAPNRFTYSVSGGKLKMLWEVRRGESEWRMGDYLDCERSGIK
jgi:hypothetical protein